MKLSLFILAIVCASVACQQVNPVEVCIEDVRLNLNVVQMVSDAVKSKDYLKVIGSLALGKPLIDKTLADCKSVKKLDILTYAFSKLTDAQKECIFAGFSVFNDGASAYEFAKNKDWTNFFTALSTLTVDVQNAELKCKQFNFRIAQVTK